MDLEPDFLMLERRESVPILGIVWFYFWKHYQLRRELGLWPDGSMAMLQASLLYLLWYSVHMYDLREHQYGIIAEEQLRLEISNLS